MSVRSVVATEGGGEEAKAEEEGRGGRVEEWIL